MPICRQARRSGLKAPSCKILLTPAYAEKLVLHQCSPKRATEVQLDKAHTALNLTALWLTCAPILALLDDNRTPQGFDGWAT
jgi:hypothetical protein